MNQGDELGKLDTKTRPSYMIGTKGKENGSLSKKDEAGVGLSMKKLRATVR
jgi:hypothetical protein